MRLSSKECLKFVEFKLLCKSDVICLKYISNEVRDPSVERIMLVDMYQKRRYKDGWMLSV